MGDRFYKMHGLGNDFVVIDGREKPVAMTENRARAIADRQTGIGCDQLILLEPSDAADARMLVGAQDLHWATGSLPRPVGDTATS